VAGRARACRGTGDRAGCGTHDVGRQPRRADRGAGRAYAGSDGADRRRDADRLRKPVAARGDDGRGAAAAWRPWRRPRGRVPGAAQRAAREPAGRAAPRCGLCTAGPEVPAGSPGLHRRRRASRCGDHAGRARRPTAGRPRAMAGGNADDGRAAGLAADRRGTAGVSDLHLGFDGPSEGRGDHARQRGDVRAVGADGVQSRRSWPAPWRRRRCASTCRCSSSSCR